MTAAKPQPQPTTDPRILRARVVMHIAQHPDNTADQISAALRAPKTQVINTLNALRTEGLIDATRGGKPPALRYHAAVTADEMRAAATSAPADALDMPGGIKPGTRKAQIWHALRGGKRLTAREITTALHAPAGACDPTISEMMRTGMLARSKNGSGVYMYHHPAPATGRTPKAQPAVAKNTGSDGAACSLPPAEAVAVPKTAPAAVAPSPVAVPVAADDSDDAMPAPDPALLASANRMLCERLEGVAHALRGCGLPKLSDVTGSEDLQPAVAALSGAYQMALQKIDELTGSVIHARQLAVEIDARREEALEECERLRTELRDARAMVDKLDDQLRTHVNNTADKLGKRQSSQYLIERGLAQNPIYTNSLDEARMLARNAARDHGRRADVFALVPVGAAVPAGVEWVEA